QFTSAQFQAPLLAAQVRLSMDGRGRAFDNIFVERLWRSVKYEEVYLKDYRTVTEAREGLQLYFTFYNQQRIHQSLDYRTPQSVHFCSAVNPQAQRTFDRRGGARAKARSSPPCSFISTPYTVDRSKFPPSKTISKLV
ncbi:MAG: transposase, partial [Pedosphaera sp.]|nr:transposase [Pedosphaera sp.]